MLITRRDFGTIGLGTAFTLGGGCATFNRERSRSRLTSVDAEFVSRSLAQLDDGLRFIDGFGLPGESDVVSPSGRLARDGVKAIHAASAFREIDEVYQVHPAWQQRMASLMGKFDSGVYDFPAHAEDSGLVTDPLVVDGVTKKGGIAEEFCESFARQAADSKTGLGSRLRLRSVCKDVLRDMRRTSPDEVFFEHRQKTLQMARLGESCNSPCEASVRLAIRSQGQDAARQRAKRLVDYSEQWASLGFVSEEPEGDDAAPSAVNPGAGDDRQAPAGNAPSAVDSAARPDSDLAAREKEIWAGARRKVLSAGGWTLGMAGVVGVSALIVGMAFDPIAASFIATAAAALVISGLIVLVCGATIRPPKSQTATAT